MDIINYLEVDNLEEHLKNRAIQEALLRPDSIEWALNYDKENLGKNLAIAYGLDVTEWEQYKNLDDFKKIDSSVSGDASAFIVLARIDLRFAELFYDKILQHATQKSITINNYSSYTLATGNVILLKYNFSGGSGRHGYLNFSGFVEGDSNITNISDGKTETKCIAKFNNLVLTRGNCSCTYSYKVWYI